MSAPDPVHLQSLESNAASKSKSMSTTGLGVPRQKHMHPQAQLTILLLNPFAISDRENLSNFLQGADCNAHLHHYTRPRMESPLHHTFLNQSFMKTF